MHPANGGRLCVRGQALGSSAALDGRLLHPMIEGRRVGWDRAIALAARRLGAVLARHGPGSVALHVSGSLLTEDYYVANKMMKGFFGSSHIHTPWLNAAGLAQVQRTAFGEDVMPAAIEDIGRADTLLLLGRKTALDHPVLLERALAAREEKGLRIRWSGKFRSRSSPSGQSRKPGPAFDGRLAPLPGCRCDRPAFHRPASYAAGRPVERHGAGAGHLVGCARLWPGACDNPRIL